MQFVAAAGAGFQIRYARILNNGGGILFWNTTINYKNGADWLRISPSSGIGEGRIRVDVLPQNLAPGSYDATITVDAGPQAGSVNMPVHIQVNAAVPATPPTPVIASVVNAASFAAGPLVRGSLGTIKGTNLGGSGLNVSFDGMPARVLYSGADQINFQVPAELGTRASSQLTVTVNGVSSLPQSVALANAGPAVFTPGILNQDNSVNVASAPALAGSVVQIFTTGLMPPDGSGTIDAKIAGRSGLIPLYAGQAPGIPGVQQVNVLVPADLSAQSADLTICSTTADGQHVCSPAVKISIRQ
jgi:uncharacterized protein (TIGR03437 family)